MQFEITTHRIGAHFAPALINGDYTGLDEGEDALLTSWVDWATDDWTDADDNTWTFAHFADAHDPDEFAECEVTALYGATVQLDLVFRRKSST